MVNIEINAVRAVNKIFLLNKSMSIAMPVLMSATAGAACNTTATIAVAPADLLRFLSDCGCEPAVLDLAPATR